MCAGWQYRVGTEDGSPPATWHSKGRQCHTLRRRRWVRVRHRDSDSGAQEQDTDTASTLVTHRGMGDRLEVTGWTWGDGDDRDEVTGMG